jgi:hypothetical protein
VETDPHKIAGSPADLLGTGTQTDGQPSSTPTDGQPSRTPTAKGDDDGPGSSSPSGPRSRTASPFNSP